MFNTEIINLKIALSKEQSNSQYLCEELKTQKIKYEMEISTLQKTVCLQSNIIEEMKAKCETLEAMNRALNESVELAESETDLNDSAWSLIETSIENENVKMVIQLASAVDQLKDQINQAAGDLKVEQARVATLSNELKSEQGKNSEMLDIQNDLARDILDLKVNHEHELGHAKIQLRKQIKKTNKMGGKMQKLQRSAEDFVTTSVMLQEYDIICWKQHLRCCFTSSMI